ncbi:MAG: hypothetical protein IID41_15320 [Planctomycetes bacterium]|nr:hypothetical protein [Planctomycetota bacterium]
MEVTPKTEEEVQPQVLEPGNYDAFVRTAEDGVSKAGNTMITLHLAAWDNKGNDVKLTDWLTNGMSQFADRKLRHFCVAAGLQDPYNAGELTAELCQEQNLRVRLRIEEENGEYLRKNRVVDYLPPANTADDVAPSTANTAESANTAEPAEPAEPARTPEASQPESAQPAELAKVPF